METRLFPCAEAEFLLSKKLLMPLPILLPSLDLFWLESRPQALLTLNFCRLDDCILARTLGMPVETWLPPCLSLLCEAPCSLDCVRTQLLALWVLIFARLLVLC